MPYLEFAGRRVKIDENGYLADMEDWDENVARALGRREGIELTPDMVDMLLFMRDYYRKHKFFPIVRAVCKNVHQPRNCVTEKFHEPVKVWKIAGLPNPGDEINIFGDWNEATPS